MLHRTKGGTEHDRSEPQGRHSEARGDDYQFERAKQTLAQAGFTNIQFANGSDQSDNAFVAGQDPQPNQEVDDPAGTTVTLQTIGAGGNNNNGGNGNGGLFGGITGRNED
ncbi:hypothetical protein GCM10023086_24550 [Streptomyces venetus]|uniref:PASTA domain-containing protein n=1 Tax=Streptomyces venetus TaxID=1701086 RepID=A0ABP8FLI7_9ACTN